MLASGLSAEGQDSLREQPPLVGPESASVAVISLQKSGEEYQNELAKESEKLENNATQRPGPIMSMPMDFSGRGKWRWQ